MGIEVRYQVVDVFTDRPLAGNAVCVVTDPVPEHLMQPLAREVNLSETTFATVTGPGTYDIRIFTPHDELPFAGHPSLGTAAVLGPGTWQQHSAGATVVIDVDQGGAVMSQPDPVLREIHAADIGAALGLGGGGPAFVMEVGGTRHAVVLSDRPLTAVRPDPAALAVLARTLKATGVGAFCAGPDGSVLARLFVAGAGVFEDPGTGSAAGALAVLAGRLWSAPADVVVLQGVEMGRPCRIEVHAEPGRMRVGGRVSSCARGAFTLA